MGKRIIRLPEVKAKTGQGHTKIYEDIAAGKFPRPVKLGAKAVGWIEDEVDAYIEKLIAERDAKSSSNLLRAHTT